MCAQWFLVFSSIHTQGFHTVCVCSGFTVLAHYLHSVLAFFHCICYDSLWLSLCVHTFSVFSAILQCSQSVLLGIISDFTVWLHCLYNLCMVSLLLHEFLIVCTIIPHLRPTALANSYVGRSFLVFLLLFRCVYSHDWQRTWCQTEFYLAFVAG